MLKRLIYRLTYACIYTKMRLVIDMKNGTEAQKESGRQSPETIESLQISKDKENTEAVKKERCKPCMHCGVHCIFLKEE